MQTLNLKIKDEYFDRVVSFLELLPKKSVIIEKNLKEKKLIEIENSIKNAKKDIEKGKTNFLRKIS